MMERRVRAPEGARPSEAPEQWNVGDWVEVRPVDQILATLDETSALDGMPFMPEMLPHCGKRFQIVKVAHKTCDASGWDYLRSMEGAVHLATRCDGSAHGGCQAACLFFWKTAWLKKVGPEPTAETERSDAAEIKPEELDRLLVAAQRRERSGRIAYRCQATEIKNATAKIMPWHPRQYIRDLRSGNVRPREFLYFLILALLKQVKVTGRSILQRLRPGSMDKKKGQQLPVLGLQPGDKVRVKTRWEIQETLDDSWKNFGLSFEADMKQYCGTVRIVEKRVERIIDERDGRMIVLKQPCVALHDVTCTGRDCRTRLFCPRGMQSFWREAWLERVEE